MSLPHTVEAASEASEDLKAEGCHQTRSFSMVTQRIASLLNASSVATNVNVENSLPSFGRSEEPIYTTGEPQVLTDYDDSDFRQHWMPDSKCKDCYECHEKFTAFRRRHHCRICGQIFCSKCCKNEIPGRFFGYSGSLRLCNYCSNQVSVHMKKLGIASSKSIHNNNENIENRFLCEASRVFVITYVKVFKLPKYCPTGQTEANSDSSQSHSLCKSDEENDDIDEVFEMDVIFAVLS
uniref:FYVE-type domain-containing protein n=1 Tax=Romanomermis culicivorax TaxID=13658 RepID=A0A915HID9_ROMCU